MKYPYCLILLFFTISVFTTVFAQHPNAVQPKVLHKEMPQYPEDAKKMVVEAQIYLNAVIGVDGTVKSTDLIVAEIMYAGVTTSIKSTKELTPLPSSHRTPAKNLIESAQKTAKLWKFIPAYVDGKPDEVSIVIPFTFKLHNKPQQLPNTRLKK